MNPSGKPSIDELLASEAQQMVMRTVKALPEDIPSMAWRGALNERLKETAGRSRARRRIWWVISPSLGLAAAAVLCFTVFMPHRTQVRDVVTPPAVSLEDQLFASHNDSDTSRDVVGSGLKSQEVQQITDDTSSEDTPTS